MVETTDATRKAMEARLTPVQWAGVVEVARLLVGELPPHQRPGAAALAIELEQTRRRVEWLG